MCEYIETPVVLITFNRPDLVKKQLEILERVKPKKLFFVSDASRPDKAGEEELVNATRELMKAVHWDCNMETIFSTQNMGCDARIVSALNEVFSKVNKAIILEDDCLPNESFFEFCECMLERYEQNQDIMYISGSKWAPDYPMEYSYGFSYNTGTWGWATWRRAWSEWHWDMTEWNEHKMEWLKGIYSRRYRKGWIKDMERYFSKESIPWDYVWRFCVGKRLSIFPAVNMISNIGFGEDATHTKQTIYGYDAKTKELEEITHPKEIYADLSYVKAVEKQYRIPLIYRIERRIRKSFDKLLGKCTKL